MTNPISGTYSSHTEPASQAARPQPAAQTTQKSTLPQDTVTLKSTGGGAHDHDGDST